MRLLLPFLLVSTAYAQVGPDYVRPPSDMPARFKGVTWREGRPSDHLSRGDWWRVFRDPTLNALMDRATANNQQLKGAIARFDQARATARMARSDFFPVLEAPLTAERQRTSMNMPSAFPLNGAQYDGPAYNALLDFTWEIDLFGKLRRQLESSRADAAAAADAMHNVLLGLQAELAVNYFRVRALDVEMRLVRAAVGFRREAFNIAEARVKAGAGSELEQAQSETEVATAEAEISSLQAQRDQLENAIAILLGSDASSFRIAATGGDLPGPPAVSSGLPTDLLERRPDVSQAERALASATAQIGVAKSYYFPSLQLLGNGGFQSGDIDVLLEPTSLMWSYGPKLTVPIFAGSKNRFNLERSRAAHDEALAAYRQALLAALGDVENSLSSLRNLSTQAGAQQRARASAERAASLARTRYEAGTGLYI
ncbi:MAG TPA: efflux transporter outer membrane subunit, partial [Prosthecobacter sp.]|nr:efflux transporter outer membrane subunit [Prosthecobacter sp.]